VISASLASNEDLGYLWARGCELERVWCARLESYSGAERIACRSGHPAYE